MEIIIVNFLINFQKKKKKKKKKTLNLIIDFFYLVKFNNFNVYLFYIPYLIFN